MIRRGSRYHVMAMVLPVSMYLWLSAGSTAVALTMTPSPTRTPTPTPTPGFCFPIVPGLTDCQQDSDCVVVDRVGCCPCSSGGVQGAINRSKQDELSQQLLACCKMILCLQVFLCQDNLGAICHSGTCTLVNAAGTPTPTPPTGVCVGDCSGDSMVTIDELVTMINIALGNAPISACPGVEQWCSSGPAGVTVDCIIVADNNALDDCRISGIGGPCGGFVSAPKECAPGLICQFPGVPDIPGVCVAGPTPTPQCSTASCEGPCTILPPCTPGSACPQYVVLGVCEPNFFNGCQCEPAQLVTPTRSPAPTPVLYHGHTCCECADAACTDFAWVEVERTCPAGCQTFMDAECEAPCHGGPQGGPATCVALTPCTTDADCDDGNGCTADRCTIDGCTHACVCR